MGNKTREFVNAEITLESSQRAPILTSLCGLLTGVLLILLLVACEGTVDDYATLSAEQLESLNEELNNHLSIHDFEFTGSIAQLMGNEGWVFNAEVSHSLFNRYINVPLAPFECPPELKVEIKDGVVSFAVYDIVRTNMKRQVVARCAGYYSILLNKEVSMMLENIRSYERQ